MSKAVLFCILFSLLLTIGTAILVLVLSLHGQHHVDPHDPSQDFCVADLNSDVRVDGFACKPAGLVEETDFFFSGIAAAGPTSNIMGSALTSADVRQIPGLNTLGISMSRVDCRPGGLNPPHLHPRATEIIFVVDGRLDVGFVTTANKLFTKTVSKGEIFVFPRGLLHFQWNSGDAPAAVIAAFNSQLPGTQSLAATLFAAAPAVPDDVLAAAFRMDSEMVEKVKEGIASYI